MSLCLCKGNLYIYMHASKDVLWKCLALSDPDLTWTFWGNNCF